MSEVILDEFFTASNGGNYDHTTFLLIELVTSYPQKNEQMTYLTLKLFDGANLDSLRNCL